MLWLCKNVYGYIMLTRGSDPCIHHIGFRLRTPKSFNTSIWLLLKKGHMLNCMITHQHMQNWIHVIKTIINHPFENGVYNLSMVMTGEWFMTLFYHVLPTIILNRQIITGYWLGPCSTRKLWLTSLASIFLNAFPRSVSQIFPVPLLQFIGQYAISSYNWTCIYIYIHINININI